MKSECVKVMIRVRPFNEMEKNQNCKSVVTVNKKEKSISLQDSKKQYMFDNIFWEESQKEVYEESAFGIVENILEGYNGTIFAYGQTGCGKTFTMLGNLNDNEQKGVIPRSCSHILTRIASDKTKFAKFSISCSFLEIYNEKIFDLLEKEKTKKELKEGTKGVYIKDLVSVPVSNLKDILRVLTIGEQKRSVGETAMNKGSSRSHCIFQISIETSAFRDNIETVRNSKLNLVDLAGSERQSKTKAQGDRLKEANNINLSLSALGNVISALVSKRKNHIPYRDSKLTRLLQDSLGGNTKTLMLSVVSPADFNLEETTSTLKYAARTSKIKNIPKRNEDPRDELLKKFEAELQELKNQLLNNQNNINKKMSFVDPSSHKEFEHNETLLLLQKEIKKREELDMQIKQYENKLLHQERKNDLELDKNELEYIKTVNKQNKIKETEISEKKEKKRMDNLDRFEMLKNNLEELENENKEELHLNLQEIQEHTYKLKNNEKELNFLKKVTQILYSKKELNYIKSNLIDLECEGKFVIPDFFFVYEKENKKLPSLKRGLKSSAEKKNTFKSFPLMNFPINHLNQKNEEPVDFFFKKNNTNNVKKFKRIKLEKLENPVNL